MHHLKMNNWRTEVKLVVNNPMILELRVDLKYIKAVKIIKSL